MAKTTFAEFSTTPADNTDINSIGVQGTNAVQNFDNAFRELMAILRRDVPGLALANTFTKTQTWTKGTDVASASALSLGDGNYFDVTGTTTITSIGTKGVGTVVILQFDGILTLTHHATDLILPGGANITTAAGDHATFVEYASGDWRCFSYQRANGASVAFPAQATVDVASATTTDIGAAASQNVRITGTTTITGLGTVAEGTLRFVRMEGALTLTHNGTGLILPNNGQNITTAANDCFLARSLGSGNWIVMLYQKASPAGYGEVAATSLSGTSTDITIPSNAKFIDVRISGASSNGSSTLAMQLGDAGGIETTGYTGGASTLSASSVSTGTMTGGAYFIQATNTATAQTTGRISLAKHSGNEWVIDSNVARTDSGAVNTYIAAGTKTLSDTLTTIRITFSNGTDTFDNGTVSARYWTA